MIRTLKQLLPAFVFLSLSIATHGQTAIGTIGDLDEVRNDLDGDYYLTADIDASSTAGANGGLGWEPIGTAAKPFTGTFDGSGHTITGLTINRPTDTDIGLFGSLGGLFGSITDVHLKDVDIVGDERVGALVGLQDNGEITGCSAMGVITCNGSDGGGLIGNVTMGDVSNCYAVVVIEGKDALGGLIGGVDQSTVSGCYAAGAVTGTGDTNGGLFGTLQDSTVDDCFSRVAVGGDVTIGGFAAKESGSTTTNCFSIGAVRGTSNVGGFLGASTGTVYNSYWNTETSGQATSAAGQGRTTVEMTTLPYSTDIYFTWDFAGTWSDGSINYNNGYPFLQSTTNLYDLTYTAGTRGTISGEPNQVKIPGADGAPVTAVPNTGYTFSQWDDGSTDNPRTDLLITSNLVAEAQFTPIIYTLTYTAGPNGSISGVSPQEVPYGSSGSEVTAVPDPNYHFAKWSDGQVDNPRLDQNVSQNIAVEAEFALNVYTLTYLGGDDYTLECETVPTIDGNIVQTVEHGSDAAAVTAVPDPPFYFASWSDHSVSNPQLSATRQDLNVVQSVTVSAIVSAYDFTLTYTAGAGGTLSGATTQYVNSGENGTPVEAVPMLGFVFYQWSDGSTQNPRTDLGVMGNIDVEAQFVGEIYTVDDLDNVRNLLSANYILRDDIDASATAEPGYNAGAGWAPIGSNAAAFTGSLDGDGFSIIGLTINRPGEDSVGLFGFAEPTGDISDLALRNVSVVGRDAVGGLIGTLGGSLSPGSPTVRHCSVTGRVSARAYVGGLVGESSLPVSLCYSTAQVQGVFSPIGGLVGSIHAPLTLSYATGDVTAVMDDSSASVGGLVGESGETIEDCYATGDVTSMLTSNPVPPSVGGLVGFGSMHGITNCYAIGFLSSATPTVGIGGLVGKSLEISVSNSYWNLETTGQPTSSGGGTGLTTEQMTYPFFLNAYQNWDFVNAWQSGDAEYQNNGYPFHKWQNVRFSLVYTAGSNGTISGDGSQVRIPGADGSPVAAVPNVGYAFAQWSDGSSNNPRTDQNITSSLAVTASFKPIEVWIIR